MPLLVSNEEAHVHGSACRGEEVPLPLGRAQLHVGASRFVFGAAAAPGGRIALGRSWAAARCTENTLFLEREECNPTI